MTDIWDLSDNKKDFKPKKEKDTIEDNFNSFQLIQQKKFMQLVQEEIKLRFGDLPKSGYGASYCCVSQGHYDGPITQFQDQIFRLESSAKGIEWGLINYLEKIPLKLEPNVQHILTPICLLMKEPPLNWEQQIAAEDIAIPKVRGYILIEKSDDKIYGLLTTKSFEHVYDEIKVGISNIPKLKGLKLEDAINKLFDNYNK